MWYAMDMNTAELDALLERHRERLRELLREIVAEEQGESPFDVPLDGFLKRSDDERAALVRRASQVARARVERELDQRGATWIVLVGDEVVASSADRLELPTVDEVLALGRPHNRVPYLFEAPLIEEIPSSARWAPVATGIVNDRYPTVPIRLGQTLLDADLDTGAHGTFADATARCS